MTISSPQVVGDTNKYEIIKIIKDCGSISRVDISRRLKLSAPAISKNVSALLEAGMIREVGTDKSILGRKPTLLEFNSTFNYVIGVDVGGKKIVAVLSDLTGNIVEWVEAKSDAGLGAWAVLEQIKGTIRGLLDKYSHLTEKIVGIAVASPGIPDANFKKNAYAFFIRGWEEIELKTIIEENFGIETIVYNDVYMDIVGEKWQGVGEKYEDLLYIKLGYGLAAKMILNGKVYNGANLASGEVGYMHLDTWDSESKTYEKWNAERYLCEGVFKEYCRLSGIDESESKLDINQLIAFCECGDKNAQFVVEKYIQFLAQIINNCVSVLDPEVVIIGGKASCLRTCDVNKIIDIMRDSFPFVPKVYVSNLGEKASVIGSVKIALELAEKKLAQLWKTNISEGGTEFE
jgi:predicted NBD/HSP70 family sugar kinase